MIRNIAKLGEPDRGRRGRLSGTHHVTRLGHAQLVKGGASGRRRGVYDRLKVIVQQPLPLVIVLLHGGMSLPCGTTGAFKARRRSPSHTMCIIGLLTGR